MAEVARRSFSPVTELLDMMPDCASESLGDWGGEEMLDIATEAPATLVNAVLDALAAATAAANHEEILQASKSNSWTRETAAIEYVEKHAHDESKILFFIQQIRVAACDMKSLTIPITNDGPERWVCDCVMDAYIQILRHRGDAGWRGNRWILLESCSEQPWLESLSGRTIADASKQELEEMSRTATGFLQCDMAFIPMNRDDVHTYVVVLNFEKREYQILDSLKFSDYEEMLRKLRNGIERCMEAAIQTNPAAAAAFDIGNWKLHEIEDIPKQKDDSSCCLFALKYMQLWDGTKLVQSLTQDDVDSFRTKLAEELIFSELNEMGNVKDEVLFIL